MQVELLENLHTDFNRDLKNLFDHKKKITEKLNELNQQLLQIDSKITETVGGIKACNILVAKAKEAEESEEVIGPEAE